MKDIEYVLDFATELGREMLEAGANIERVNLSIELICKTYNLSEISLFSLNSHILLAAKDSSGYYASRQVSVPINAIRLERLRQLNNLSYRVAREKPAPSDLQDLLYSSLMVKDYPDGILLLSYVVAMTCLCRLFQGVWQDIVVADISTVALFFITKALSKQKLNRIVNNLVCMFTACVIALFFTYIGFAQNFFAIIITNAFYLIPGVQMVNAFRNILCGNEMNGIIEMLKVILEVVTICAGLFVAYFFFGQWLIAW